MTKNYVPPVWIASMMAQNGKSHQDRKVWSIGLESVLIPFFTATNTMGESAIPSEALGCPIRLAKEKDGSVKFSSLGRPVTRVVKPITEKVNLMREYFVGTLVQHTEAVAKAQPEEYSKQIALSVKAGKPLVDNDRKALDHAIQLRIEAELEQARCAELEAEKTPIPEKEKELVTA